VLYGAQRPGIEGAQAAFGCGRCINKEPSMTLRAILALCFALLAAPAWAQAAKPAKPAAAANDPVVARVNGTELHRSDAVELMRSLPPQLQKQPPDKLYPMVLDQMVGTLLVSQAGRKSKLQDDPIVKKRLALAQDQIIADAYVQRLLAKSVTDDKLHARYDKIVNETPEREEVKARHILLPTEEEAKAVIVQLKGGADFAKLAGEKTTDPAGKASGGDLGYFTKDEMVPEFADAAFKLKNGEYTETPVKSQFGWHVIKVEDRRTAKPPSFDQMKPRLANDVSREIVSEKIKELKVAAKIDVYNPDGSKVGAAPPPAAAPASDAPAAGAPTLAPETAPGAAPEGTPTLAPETKPPG
jgi:peptidyl-prolyl cis-trans isomerase C